LHQGNLDKAHSVLLTSPLLKADPWITAGEIALSAIRNRSSSLIKVARRMVDSQNFSPFHLSELAGALATLEARDGSLKNARRLCDFSMIQPAENAIAQAAWLSRNVGGFGSQKPKQTEMQSNEANAWTLFMKGSWQESLEQAKQWHSDQPFSSRPASLSAYIASTALDDFADAESTLRAGLVSNPDDIALRNNFAFVLARQGKVDQAQGVSLTAARRANRKSALRPRRD
jgi:hypothetical protein